MPIKRLVWVWSAKAGKVSDSDESVHHRNGVRDDNRPENLEIWTRPQPTEIRVSDAVAWAREIIARYEGSTNTSNNAQGPC
jgi:HNH endonuclease